MSASNHSSVIKFLQIMYFLVAEVESHYRWLDHKLFGIVLNTKIAGD